MSPFVILVGTAGILAIISIIKPSWPLLGVATLLLAVALLVGKT